MPYARKKYTKRGQRKSYKKSYSSRYKDDKINTAIERKISQIAKKEDVKNRNLRVRMLCIGTNVLARQASSYGYQVLPDNSTSDTAMTGQYLANMTELAGSSYGLAGVIGDNASPNDDNNVKKEFFVTKIQAFLQFALPDTIYDCRVRVCLVYIPNANYSTANNQAATSSLKPNRYICGVVSQRNKGIFRESYLNAQDFSKVKHVMLKSKQFTLRHTKASTGKSDAAYSGGMQFKELNWSINFPGRGKRFVYNADVADGDAEKVMSSGNIYLTVNHDAVQGENRSVPIWRGALGTQFYVGKNLAISVRDATTS